MSTQGLDVSEFQGEIDWERVKNAGYRFAMLRDYGEMRLNAAGSESPSAYTGSAMPPLLPKPQKKPTAA